MPGNKISSTQLTIWIITAMIGPIVFYSDGNWTATLIIGFGFTILDWLAARFGRRWQGSVYAIVQTVWISVLLSQLLYYSALCWPTGQRTFPVIPLTILVLSGVSAIKGDNNTASGISVLFWIVFGLIGTVILLGVGNIEIAYLQPQMESPNIVMLLVMLLPAVVGFLDNDRCEMRPFVIVAGIASVISVWIAGTFSPQFAKSIVWPFYNSAKSVHLFDIASRLEALVSVGVTIGNYALYSMLFCAVGAIFEPYGYRKYAIVATGAIAAVIMLIGIHIATIILVIICALLWLFLPLLGLVIPKKKE